jgi:hypothetical protein
MGLVYHLRAFHARGLDPYASVTVPEMVRQSPDFGSVSTTFVDLPLSPWSRDRTLNKVGRLMYQDARTFPEVSEVMALGVLDTAAEAHNSPYIDS